MDWVIPFAATLSEDCIHTLRDLQLPHLARLLARLVPTVRQGSDEFALSTPHERALATALGWRGDDGMLPWAARLAAIDGIDVGGSDTAWGLITPVHWEVASDHVVLVDPAALELGEVESRALLNSARPLFDDAGWRVEYGAPLRWYAAHDSLRELACASPDRVIGRSVDLWMPADARVARIRRLQSEVQMLLYTDATNAAREAKGALAVNSFWLSGCGVAQTEPAVSGVQIDDSLRASALAEDWAAWADAWRALDAGLIADLRRRAESGESTQLTLCGERHAQRFENSPRSLWARASAAFRSPPVAPLLEAL